MGPNSEKGPMEQGSSADGPAEPGSLVVSVAFQRGSAACAGRTEAALDTGATDIPPCFAWLRARNGLLKKSGYDVVVPYSTSSRLEFGSGQVETVHNAADFLIVLAGHAGVSVTFLAERNIPALLGMCAVESLWRH